MKELSIDPIGLYESELRDKFAENAEKCFNDLVSRSGVNADENRATVAHYHEYEVKSAEADKKVSGAKGLKTFVTVLIVLFFVAAAAGVLVAVFGPLHVGIPVAVGCTLAAVGFIVLLKLKVNKTLRSREALLAETRAQADAYHGEAERQMAPLNILYSWEHTSGILKETTDIISLYTNSYYAMIEAFHSKYGLDLGHSDEHGSVAGVLCGMAAEHPFLTYDMLDQSVGSKTYTGSLQVTWYETVYDSNGNVSTRTHVDTLVATVVKPIPVYNVTTATFYGNEAAPRLSFTHKPSYAHTLTQKELEKKIRTGQKEARRIAKNALGSDRNFTEMTNSEFEVLFGAFDRNDDLQFRMMFTPLAQRNMVALMKDKKYFGDDFTYKKVGTLSALLSAHARHWTLDTDSSQFMDYDIDSARNKFMDFQTSFFRDLYFELAPFLAVPLNLQQEPFEFEETADAPRNFSEYAAEAVANLFPDNVFAHPDTDTKVILKTRFAGKAGKTDVLEVTAYSFRGEPRVDYISKMAGDGNYYNVPVPWVEYIPIVQTSYMAMRDVGVSRSDWLSICGRSEINDYLLRYAAGGDYVMDKGILAFKLAAPFDENADARFGELGKSLSETVRSAAVPVFIPVPVPGVGTDDAVVENITVRGDDPTEADMPEADAAAAETPEAPAGDETPAVDGTDEDPAADNTDNNDGGNTENGK